MEERQNTIFCEFDQSSLRITAYHIHELIFDNLRLPDADIRTIQIDGPRRRVYIKFHSSDKPHFVLKANGGRKEYRHDNGVLSKVNISMASMGSRRIRLAGLAPVVKDNTIREVQSTCGEVKEVYEENWAKGYPYQVFNGVRFAMINLKKIFHRYLQ